MHFLACLFFLAIIAIVECVEFRKLYDGANTTLGKNFVSKMTFPKKLVQVATSVRSLDLMRTSGWFWSTASSFSSEQTVRAIIDTESLDVRSAAGVVANCAINSVRLLKADGTLSRFVAPLEALSSTLASARFLVEARLDDREFTSETAFVLFKRSL
ncbi:hypothetical protein BC829DRAFT_181646 [Chytridium lagenaria]|nr:hypothetical protein BC829DRAFT_181646 [Chytridium lagenaria]